MEKRVRPIAICLFRNNGSIFVEEGYDKVKREIFYRPLGGMIEFGEYGRQTVAREIREEIGAEIANPRYIGAIENIFTFEGWPGHEIVLVYEGDFVDRSIYEKGIVEGIETAGKVRGIWKPLEDFQSGQARLYPEGLLMLLARH